mgnify:FL=1
MVGQLEQKVALITGGAAGIGFAVATRFLAEGAQVVVLDRVKCPPLVSDTVTDNFESVIGDVRAFSDQRSAVEAAINRFGKLDIFVGNAGIYDNRRPFEAFDGHELDKAFDELFAINVKGYMLGALAALPALSAARGSIIFTGSVSGEHCGFGGALYVAAKHAVTGLTRQLAYELAPHIRVNAVAPGYAQTELRGLESLRQEKTSTAPVADNLPLKCIASSADYAEAYVFLASEAGSRIATGTVLAADGGLSLRGPGPFDRTPKK